MFNVLNNLQQLYEHSKIVLNSLNDSLLILVNSQFYQCAIEQVSVYCYIFTAVPDRQEDITHHITDM